MQKKTTIPLLILILLLTIPSNTFASNAKALPSQEKEPDLLFLIDTFQYIKEVYPFEIEDSHLIEEGLKGMLQSLDPYSDYYTPDEAADFYKDTLGTFSGIGVYIEEKDSYINVKDTIKNAPGEKAGLKKDDLIISIDGKDIKNLPLNEATKLIKGPSGTNVRLGIKKATNKFPIYIEVTRGTININPVSYMILENKIGYIKLSEFSQTANIEMKKALDELDKKGIKEIILDLRDNPGGLLNQAIEISKPFIPSGPIVHIKERNKTLLTHISTTAKPKYKLVLLVNENSASASEIVAGAIKDTKSGIIIGKKTFGKGIVQSLISLKSGGIIKITTAEYLTPNKINIHGIGVEPDIVVENLANDDKQLKMAIETLR